MMESLAFVQKDGRDFIASSRKLKRPTVPWNVPMEGFAYWGFAVRPKSISGNEFGAIKRFQTTCAVHVQPAMVVLSVKRFRKNVARITASTVGLASPRQRLYMEAPRRSIIVTVPLRLMERGIVLLETTVKKFQRLFVMRMTKVSFVPMEALAIAPAIRQDPVNVPTVFLDTSVSTILAHLLKHTGT